ncbi:MAG: acetylgalactosaminidase, partial [Kiritimatiellae bacterium]|nr:acetylgalactosaminidase [Kiritimatiellia bacterium]
IRTYRGRTILVQHDTTSPRPYSRINLISGTRGVLADYPLRVALAPDTHAWMKESELEALKAKYVHPLWDKNGEAAKKAGGHGGMDFLMDLRLCHCLQHGLPLDIDVYDSALWSSVVELSERSVERDGKPVKVPDFTRGAWKIAEPLGIVTV